MHKLKTVRQGALVTRHGRILPSLPHSNPRATGFTKGCDSETGTKSILLENQKRKNKNIKYIKGGRSVPVSLSHLSVDVAPLGFDCGMDGKVRYLSLPTSLAERKAQQWRDFDHTTLQPGRQPGTLRLRKAYLSGRFGLLIKQPRLIRRQSK